jgi:multiple sugar transport system ATP-binding protein
VKTARGMLKARTSADIAAAPGEQVGLSFKPERLSLFNASTGRAIRTALHDATFPGARRG